jgi:hypothetical protein
LNKANKETLTLFVWVQILVPQPPPKALCDKAFGVFYRLGTKLKNAVFRGISNKHLTNPPYAWPDAPTRSLPIQLSA